MRSRVKFLRCPKGPPCLALSLRVSVPCAHHLCPLGPAFCRRFAERPRAPACVAWHRRRDVEAACAQRCWVLGDASCARGSAEAAAAVVRAPHAAPHAVRLVMALPGCASPRHSACRQGSVQRAAHTSPQRCDAPLFLTSGLLARDEFDCDMTHTQRGPPTMQLQVA